MERQDDNKSDKSASVNLAIFDKSTKLDVHTCDISYGFDGFSIYDNCDLYIGFRDFHTFTI